MEELDGNDIVENSPTSDSEGSPLQERRRLLDTHSNRLRQMRDKLERLLRDEDPAELDLDELQEGKDIIASIKRKVTRENDALYQEETDESRRESDEVTWTSLQELLRMLSALSSRLVAIKSAISWVKEIDEQLDELVTQAAANPDMRA